MIVVQSSKRAYRGLEKEAARITRAVLRELGARNAHCFVFLVSDRKMQAINRRFRKKNKATNVLSFPEKAPFPHPEVRGRTLGEVFLAPDYIEKKRESLGYLLVHGILHLFGYDHVKKRDRIRMEKLEKRLGKKIKL